MKTYAATDLKQNIGDVLAATNQGPVLVTRHNKTRYVLMTVEAYEQNFAKDPRRSYASSEARPEHMAMVDQALAKFEKKQ